VNSGIQPLQNLGVLNRVRALSGDAQAWARHYVGPRPGSDGSAGARDRRRFLVGDAPTVADVYLVPQLYNARRFALDLAPYPTLLRAEANCQRFGVRRRPPGQAIRRGTLRRVSSAEP
jgi:maleylpyruvate isomerase